MPMVMVVIPATAVNTDGRPVVRSVIIRRWPIVVRLCRGVWRSDGRLGHLKIHSIRNTVLGTKHVSSAKVTHLWKLVGRDGRRADHEIGRSEIVERPIGISEHFDVHRRVSDILAVDIDPSSRSRGIDQDVVSHGVVRSRLRPWR